MMMSKLSEIIMIIFNFRNNFWRGFTYFLVDFGLRFFSLTNQRIKKIKQFLNYYKNQYINIIYFIMQKY